MKEFEEVLIKFCKMHKCFWDKRDPDFKNIRQRNELLERLGDEIDVPAKTLKSRWRSLRNTFRIEYGKECCDKGYETKWKFYEMLSYLKEVQPNNLSDTPNFKFCDITQSSTRLESSEDDISQIQINKFDESEVPHLENNYIDEFLYTYDGGENNDDDENNFSVEEKRRKLKKYLKTTSEKSAKKLKMLNDTIVKATTSSSPSSPPPPPLPPLETPPQSDANFEINKFFQCLALRVNNENLSRDEMDEFQENLLHFVHQKMREIRFSRESNNVKN